MAMASRERWLCVALVGTWSALAAVTANADEIGVFGLLGAYNTDNALRNDAQRRRDTVAYFSLATYGNWETGRLRTAWTLAEEGTKYFNGSFGSKTNTTGTLKADYNAIPDVMTWRLRDNTGQVLVTPAQPDTPLNRANFNVFSTGPAFHIPVTRGTWVGAEGMYSNTYYEKQTLNGDKVDLALGFNKNLGHKTDVGLYVGGSEGTYKAFGRYRTENASVRFAGEGAFTTMKAEAGLNRAVQPFRSGNLPFFDFNMERKFHDTSLLQMKLQRKITDPSEQFGQISGLGAAAGSTPGSIQGGNNTADLLNNLGLFDSRLARIGYETKRARTEVRVGLYYRKEDTLPGAVVPEHRRIEGIDGQYHLIWGSKTGIVVYGSYEIHHGELFANRVDREMVVGTEIAKPIWTIATRWVLTIEHRRRTGDDTLNNYKELRIGAYLRFSKFIFNRVRV
jgi:hypothetical protein